MGLYARGKNVFGQVRASAIYLAGTLLSFTAAQFNQIMASFGTVTFDRSVKIAKVALTATTATTGGAVFSWANPEAGAIQIVRAMLDVTTVSTGAATLAIGTTATNATTSSNNLLDAVDVNAATGLFDNITDKGTAGKSRQRLAAGKWVTGTGSASTVGMVGFVYLHYVNV
jgi:hypothetical protein